MKTSNKSAVRRYLLQTSLLCAVALTTAVVQAQDRVAGKGSDPLSQSMMSGMESMKQMKPSGDVDKDFAMMMKMHHQQALDMAKVELDQGKSSELKKMAKEIMTGQKKEIEQFDKWLQNHK